MCLDLKFYYKILLQVWMQNISLSLIKTLCLHFCLYFLAKKDISSVMNILQEIVKNGKD